MAIKKIRGAKSNTPYNYGIWLVDNDSDISLLPTSKDKKDNSTTTSIGSLTYVANGAKKYILSNDDTWKDITSGEVISDNQVQIKRAYCKPSKSVIETFGGEDEYYSQGNYPLLLEKTGNIVCISGYVMCPDYDIAKKNNDVWIRGFSAKDGLVYDSRNEGFQEKEKIQKVFCYGAYTIPEGFRPLESVETGVSFAGSTIGTRGEKESETVQDFITIQVNCIDETGFLVIDGLPGAAVLKPITAFYYTYPKDYSKDFDENGYLKKELRG